MGGGRQRSRAPHRVVVAGLGDTGVLVAVHLRRGFDVVGISTRPALVSGQELGTRLADPARWRQNYLLPFRRLRRLDGVRTLHGRSADVDETRREVRVELADGTETVAPYDVLVIASGVTNGFWRHSRVEGLDGIEAGLAAVTEQVDAATTTAIVGGGASGVSVAVNLARRHPGKQVHLFYSQDEPLPGYHPDTRSRMVRQLERAGVRLHPGHRAAVPDGFRADRLTTDPVAWSTGQAPFEADLVLWTIGEVRPNSDFLPAGMLDEDGFVRVDDYLQGPGHPGVFAVGDIAASDPNRCSARNWGYRVVTHNIKATVRDRGKLRRFSPPRYRWGSITGLQDDGMVVFQPNGKAFRVPRWAVQPLLFRFFTHLLLYGGLRPTSDR